MRIEVTRDVEAFAERAEGFLAERLERNVLATVLMNVRASARESPVDATFAVGLSTDTERPLAAALRTPPWQLLATEFSDATAARQLLENWLELDPELDGVSGEPATARAIAEAWCERTGGSAQLRLAEVMHELTAVRPPMHPAPGRLRQAGAADRPLLIEWDQAFAVEARSGGDPAEAAARVARRLAGGCCYIWDAAGPVSMLAHTAAVAGAARIGPVYTPPEHRGNGYASSAVAALSRLLLDRGADRCMLYTDVANPTSNRIYAAIGYRHFAHWEVFDFQPPAPVAVISNA